MIETLVSGHTAINLSYLDFKKKTQYVLLSRPTEENRILTWENLTKIHDITEQDKITSLPSQTQVLKWLRETHNYYVTVLPNTINTYIATVFTWEKIENSFMSEVIMYKEETYETALETALKKITDLLYEQSL